MKKNTETAKTLKAVFIPKVNKNDDALFVALNGKRVLVKKGEAVELPEAFAEVIENSLKAQSEAESFIEVMSRNN